LPDDYNAEFVDTVTDTISNVKAIVKAVQEEPTEK